MAFGRFLRCLCAVAGFLGRLGPLLLGGGGLLRRGEELSGCLGPHRCCPGLVACLACDRLGCTALFDRPGCPVPGGARLGSVGPCPVAGRPALCLLGLRLGLALCRLGLADPLLVAAARAAASATPVSAWRSTASAWALPAVVSQLKTRYEQVAAAAGLPGRPGT